MQRKSRNNLSKCFRDEIRNCPKSHLALEQECLKKLNKRPPEIMSHICMQAWIQHSCCSLFKCSKTAQENILWERDESIQWLQKQWGCKNYREIALEFKYEWCCIKVLHNFKVKVSNQNFWTLFLNTKVSKLSFLK